MNISIHKYLPHHPPMQMVDTITDISNTHVVTEFTVTDDCIFVEVGLIENMAQTCSAIVGQFLFGIEDSSNYVIGYISAIKKLEIFTLPKVQEVVRTEAELLSRFDSDEYYICSMRCDAFVGYVLMATAELNLVIKNLTE